MSWNAPTGIDPRRAAQLYARVDVETAVDSADPLRLVLMLYDGALRAIAEASGHLARRDVAAKGAAIGRAIDIVENGLVASVDAKAGGALAGQLVDLYRWIEQCLTRANARNDVAALEEAASLLLELRGAWQQLDSRRGEG